MSNLTKAVFVASLCLFGTAAPAQPEKVNCHTEVSCPTTNSNGAQFVGINDLVYREGTNCIICWDCAYDDGWQTRFCWN